jgi:predicted RNA-binding protein with PUA domain
MKAKEGAKKVKRKTKAAVTAFQGTSLMKDGPKMMKKGPAKAEKGLKQAEKIAVREEKGQGVNLGSMSDGNAMMKKGMPMMRAGMKGPSMNMKIQYGQQSGMKMNQYKVGAGKNAPGMILSKHMKGGPKMGHKK